MDLIEIVGGLVALAVAALAFGFDSRDGLARDEAGRWEAWRASAEQRRGRLGSLLGSPLEVEGALRRFEFEHYAATQRMVGPTLRIGRPRLPSLGPVAYALGEWMVRVGGWLQRLAGPRAAAA